MKPAALEAADLTKAQRRVLECLGQSELSSSFYLSGGVAIGGFYLHHRQSLDLDLFTDENVPLETLRAFLASIPGAVVKSYQKVFDRRIFLLEIEGEPLELEFTRYPFPRVADVVHVEGMVAVDDLRDLLANKIAAFADRFEPKDEIDLYFLLRTEAAKDIQEAVGLAERKFQIPGLRYILQRRLLAVSSSHPSTQPVVTREEIARFFRELAKTMVRQDSDE